MGRQTTDLPGHGHGSCFPSPTVWPLQGGAHPGGPAQPSGRTKGQAHAYLGRAWLISQNPSFPLSLPAIQENLFTQA